MASLLLKNGDSADIQISDLTNTSVASIRRSPSAKTYLVIGFSRDYLMTLSNTEHVCSLFKSAVTSNRTITSIQVYAPYGGFIHFPLCFATSLFGSIVKRGLSICPISFLFLESMEFRLSPAELLPFRNSFVLLFMSIALETFKVRECFISNVRCSEDDSKGASFPRMALEDFRVPATYATGFAVLSKALLKNTSVKFVDVGYVCPELYKTLSVVPDLTVLKLELDVSDYYNNIKLFLSILGVIEKCKINHIRADFGSDGPEELFYCFLSSIRKSGNVEKLQLAAGYEYIEFPSTFVLSFLCQGIEMERIKCEAWIWSYCGLRSAETETYNKQLQRLKSCIAEIRPNFSFK